MTYASTVDAGLQGVATTIYVAASNASAKSQQRADFLCSGSGDQATIASAVSALSSVGGRILFSEGDFYTSSPYLVTNSNIDFAGMGGSTKFHSTTTNACFASSTTAFSDVSFELITFMGPVSNTVSVPTRARTTSGSGIDSAIKINGSLDTADGSFPVITNITTRNCNFRNTTWSPIRIFGITGKTVVTECEFYNCQDPGFVYNQEVMFNDNHIQMSADNGVSISRASNKITCVGNTFENICQHAIWVAGFTGTEGPNNFTVSGNTVKVCGNNGIYVSEAPKFGVITGNEITQGYNRGAVDQLSDTACSGIAIIGYPSTSAPSFTDYATGISITGNHIYQCPKSGIYYDGVEVLDIKNNLICDTGTQFLSDGITAITASYVSQNVGIMAGHLTTNTNVVIQNNTVVDQRATAYCNWAMYPYSNFTGTGVTASGNIMAGCRNSSNVTPPTGQNGMFGQGSDGAVTLDGTVTVSWASKAGSVYTLTRDVYCTDLTVNSGVSIAAVGYTINCSGTLTNNGTISTSGSNASGATAGAGATGNMLRGGGSGTTATTGAGTAGNTLSNGLGGAGGSGGNSGASNGGSGGTLNNPTGGGGGVVAAQQTPWSAMGLFINGSGTITGWAGGTAGGSGAGDGTNAGGGPGGGGGVLLITARYVVLGSGGLFKAFGGNGGNGAAGNAAAGGGGGGGLLIINTTSYTGVTPTAANSCTGGSAGTSQGTGTAASAGANGSVYLNIFS